MPILGLALMRCAINFTPTPDDRLTVAAVQWLGRDAFTGQRIEGVETAGILERDRAFLTAPPRRYGFHATLKAPFHLAAGEDLASLAAALDEFVARCQAVVLPAMQIALIDDYYALIPAGQSPDLLALAEDIVTSFDRFRAPLAEADFARRWRTRLGERELNQMLRWGYPFIFEDYRFHMTLTGPVPRLEREHVLVVLEHHFGALATAPLNIGQLALFIEPEPYAPLLVHSVHQLARTAIRKIA
jgi:putative phosphonate metabolism protein